MLENFSLWFRRRTPAQILTAGFGLVILTGTLLLWLPFSHNEGFTPGLLDCLFVSTSAVCVTGLTTLPIGYTFNPLGRFIILILIQIGGWGVATAAILFALFVGRKISLKSRQLLVEASNLYGYMSAVRFIRIFVLISLICEGAGALLSLPVFLRDHDLLSAIGFSVFHSVSSFNNAGFDILGGFDSLLVYKNDVYMNVITCALVLVGGFGFLALMDIWSVRKTGWRSLALNTKIVIMMTFLLFFGGMITLKATTGQTWLQAGFQSVIARTAGFNTYPLSDFSQAGIVIFCLLMFIGAAPGSTGGGIKVTTFFALIFKAISSTMHNNRDSIFFRHIPRLVFEKALTVTAYGVTVVFMGTLLLLCFEPQLELAPALVEVTSAFATVGSSTGITPTLCTASKIVLMICMFIGRLGPVTIATLYVVKGLKDVHYTDEQIMIG